MNKREREEAAMIKIGGGKKGGKKPKIRAAEEQEDYFQNLDINLLKEFGFLKVSPPTEKAHLEPKLAELNAKLAEFTKLGEQRLKEEEEQVMAGTIGDEPVEEKREYEDRQHTSGRGGRGGRGGFRGGRGGRGGNRGSRPNAGGDRRREEDDDVYVSSGDEGAQQQKAKRPANKKENLALDEGNYPTL